MMGFWPLIRNIYLFYYDVISMWHRAFETPIGRKIRDFPQLENGWSLTRKSQLWYQIAKKGQFPIPSQKIFYIIFKNCVKLEKLKIETSG